MLDSLHLRGAPLSEPQVAAVAAGALCALQHLHQDCHMLHRDLKAANFLLTRAGALKLADFGVSVQLSTTLSKRSTAIGTPPRTGLTPTQPLTPAPSLTPHWTNPNPNPNPSSNLTPNPNPNPNPHPNPAPNPNP